LCCTFNEKDSVWGNVEIGIRDIGGEIILRVGVLMWEAVGCAQWVVLKDGLTCEFLCFSQPRC
jgi:hypothetical protein